MARSKYLGVLLGVMLGAGSAFAATTMYNYATTVQATATVVQGQVITAPGLEVVGSSSINFGEVEQGGTSKEVLIAVKNVGNEPLQTIKVVGKNLPAGLSVEAAGIEIQVAPLGTTGPGYRPGYINPGETAKVELQLKATEDLAPGSYEFQIEITGVK